MTIPLTFRGVALLATAALTPLRAQMILPPLLPLPWSMAAVSELPVVTSDPGALQWDAEAKDSEPKPGDLAASFQFVATNVSNREVMIHSLRTSCGCTVAQLPGTPYPLAPGAKVPIAVTLDLRGKFGTLTKTVSVTTSAGVKSLIVRANLPPASPPALPAVAPVASAFTVDRARNIQNALADRQAVFKGDCARCHVENGVGKMGAELYTASCGICHEAEHRASMVPDLKVPRSPRDRAFWQRWITEGKPGTLMPAFATAHGGPLTQEQVDSLADYLDESFPRKPQPAAILPPFPTVASPRADLPVFERRTSNVQHRTSK